MAKSTPAPRIVSRSGVLSEPTLTVSSARRTTPSSKVSCEVAQTSPPARTHMSAKLDCGARTRAGAAARETERPLSSEKEMAASPASVWTAGEAHALKRRSSASRRAGMAALRKFMCDSYLFYVDFAAAADGRRGFRPILPQGARGVKARAKRKRGVCKRNLI